MKKIINLAIILLLAVQFFSCEPEGFLAPEDESFKSGIIVFVDPKIFSDVEAEFKDLDVRELEKKKKVIIKSQIKKKYKKLDLDTANIHIQEDLWFFSEKISSAQIKELRKQQGEEVLDIFPNYALELQGRKPMMQGSPLPQGRKPMMQQDWRYNALNFSSELILWIGGGTVATTAPANRTVWIMDTGIDITHQDLNGHVVADLGFSAFPGSTYTIDGNGHGTMIAGVIGAKAYNEVNNPSDIGLNGVYPGARMVSVKVLDDMGDSDVNKLVLGINYISARALAGDVVNISLGKEIKNQCKWGNLGTKIQNLANKGVFIVFSAGNESDQNASNFPSCLADGNFMISVGSIDMYCAGETVVYSSFSNFGTITGGGQNIPIWVAPGNQIFSTFPPTLVGTGDDHGTYALVAGTSFSAAMMSGVLFRLGNLPLGNSTVKRGGDNLDYPIAKVVERQTPIN